MQRAFALVTLAPSWAEYLFDDGFLVAEMRVRLALDRPQPGSAYLRVAAGGRSTGWDLSPERARELLGAEGPALLVQLQALLPPELTRG